MDFDCQRCGWCCRNININVSHSDILRWAKEKRIDILNKISYLDHDDPKKKGFYIVKTVQAPKSACPYLTIIDGQSSCSIYDTRPRSCKEFPKAHAKGEKQEIECPARGDFEIDEKALSELRRDQSLDFRLAEDRKERLLRILESSRQIATLLGEIKEFGDDPTESLWVDGLGTERTGWTGEGASPYLSTQNEPTDYVWTVTKKVEHGDFTFADHITGSGTINSVTFYVYAKNDGGREISFFIHDGTSWTEYAIILPTTYGWSNTVTPVLDSWTKIDGAKLYIKQPNQADKSWIDAAYLIVDYTPVGVVEKGFSDSGSGSDVFTNPYRAVKFDDVGSGSDVFTIVFKALGFTDTGAGADVFTQIWRAMGFSDSGAGADVFTNPYRAVVFVDTGAGGDVFAKVITFQTKAFVDIGSGSDVFILLRFLDFTDTIAGADVFTLTRPMYVTDVGSGADVFGKVTTVQWKSFVDTVSGADVFTVIYRELGFSDVAGGSDVFILTQFRAFVDTVDGVDVITLTRPMYFTDTGQGSDVFTNPFRAMGFSDTGLGTDIFQTLLRMMGFTDVSSGVDVFLLLQEKGFVDSGAGAEVFTILYKEMGFADVGAGTDTFGVTLFINFTDLGSGADVFTLTRPMYMTDVGQGLDVFTNPFRFMDMTDAGSGVDVFSIIFRALGFDDVGAGSDIFNLLRPIEFLDAGMGTELFGIVASTSISEEDMDAIVDKVWDEMLADHLIAGSTGEKLDATGTATTAPKSKGQYEEEQV